MFLTFVVNFMSNNQILNTIKQIHYILSMLMSISVNFSPILILSDVIKTKNTELIYLPQAFVNLINLILWFIYAMLINDIYQIITNIVGIFMCLIQLTVYLYYTCFYSNSKIKPTNNDILV